MSEKIIKQDTLERYKEDMIAYSIETNRRRAVPDVKDGLKFVQRKILYSTSTLNGENELLKTARVVGDVIGKYHPHGDSSVTDAIKIMCNWFESKLPLMYSESNMGSMQGDGAAANRYTEVMLSVFAVDAIFVELKGAKEVVDWVPTFDNKNKEPEYFPMRIPLLLVNGVLGIGTGLKTEIPKHNLNEVIDATIRVIKDPKAPVVLIPDQCMACEIIDTNWKSICNKGNGKYIVRAVIDIEHWEKPAHDVLVIKSIPDRVFFDKGNSQNGGVLYKILEMVEQKKLPEITKYEEDSHGNDMRILFHLKPGADANYVREMLYKNTSLQDTCSVNFEVLDGIKPLRMSYKSYIEYFIEQRKITKFRYYCIKLQEVRTEYHQLDAYVKVIESGEINKIINLIRTKETSDDTELIELLIKKVKLTDIQAKYIIESNLKQLSINNLNRYKKRLEKDTELDKLYLEKITNEQLILDEIVEELEYFKKKYGTPRKCKVIKKEEVTNIPKGQFRIVITENNYIKKVSPTEHVGAYHGDNPKFVLNVENTENILLFSTQGKVFRLPVHKIPVTEKSSMGIDIRLAIKGLVSDIVSVIYEPTIIDISKNLTKHCLVSVTNNNCIKQLTIDDFLTVPPSGICFTKLNPGDFVKDVKIIPNGLDVVLYSGRKALRFNIDEIPVYRRNTLGVTAMKLNEEKGEHIDGISAIYPDMTDIVVITDLGKVNRFNVSGLPISTRNKTGSNVIKLVKGDQINTIIAASEKDIIKVYTKNGQVELPVKDIVIGSTISAGNKLINGPVVECSVMRS